MLTGIQIRDFRGFRDLRMQPLKRINLVAGQNNTGKTALLEAVCLLLYHPTNPLAGDLHKLFRAFSSNADMDVGFWHWIFHNKDLSKSAEITGTLDGGQKTGVALTSQVLNRNRMPPQDRRQQFAPLGSLHSIQVYATCKQNAQPLKAVAFSTRPSDPVQDAIDYNRVVLKRRKRQVEEMLRQIEPHLQAIEALQTGRQAPLIYADIGLSEMIPVTQLGQGFCRLLDIYSEILASEAQVLLIDEVEKGIHHSVMPTVWRGLANAAEQANVQIFATTHSWECIVAAHKTFAETLDYDFALHRLERIGDDIKAITYDRDALEAAIKAELEVR